MSDFTFAFRRMTKGLPVTVSNTPTQANRTTVPDGFIKPSYKAFMVFNPNVCVVTLRGTSWPAEQPKPTVANLAEDDDWNFPPGFVGVFSTQNPIFMSAKAKTTPIYPNVPADGSLVPLLLFYGMGV